MSFSRIFTHPGTALVAAAGIMAGVLAPMQGNAAQIVFSDSFSLNRTNTNQDATANLRRDDTFGIGNFDPTLGTLNSVEINLQGTLTNSARATFSRFTSVNGTVELSAASAQFQIPFVPGPPGDFTFNVGTRSKSCSHVMFFAIASCTATLNAKTSAFNFSGTISGGDLVDFIRSDPGQTQLFYQVEQTGTVGSETADLDSREGRLTTVGTLSLTYDYTPGAVALSTPGNAAGIALGFCALGLLRRRAGR